jgi:hypothetical protein
LRLTIAAVVIAVAVLAVILVLGSGGSTPVTEAGLPQAIPASIRPSCHNLGRTKYASDQNANVEYKCDPPYGESEGAYGASLSYLQYPDAKASEGLNGAEEFLLANGYEPCQANASDRIQLVYPDGDAWCVQSQIDKGLEIAWDIDTQRSPVMGAATFNAPTSKTAALRAWQSIIQSG